MATSLAKISIKDSSSWNTFLNLIYPIGSLYFSSNSTSPATKFGGTWSALYASSANSARYLKLGPWGAGGDNTITVNNMPSHNHTNANATWIGYWGSGYSENHIPSQGGISGWGLKGDGTWTTSSITDTYTGGGQGLLSLLPLRLLLVSHRLILGWWSKWLPR